MARYRSLRRSEQEFIKDEVLGELLGSPEVDVSIGEVYWALVNAYKEVRRTEISAFMAEEVGDDYLLFKPRFALSRLIASRKTTIADLRSEEVEDAVQEDAEPHDRPPEMSDVPNYDDETWREIEEDVLSESRRLAGEYTDWGSATTEALKVEIRQVSNRTKPKVDLRRVVKSKSASKKNMGDFIAPILEKWDVPYTSPYGTTDRVEGAAEKVEELAVGPLSYLTGGYFRIYVERTVAMLLFFVSAAMLFSTLLGGIGDLLTQSGIFWTLVFAVSAYWWGEVLHFRFPGKGWLKGSGKWWRGASISDEVLMVMFVISIGLSVLAFTGSVELLAFIPLVGLVLGSATPGSIFLITGIVGILILYHAEDMPGQMGRYVLGARRAGRRINQAPRGAISGVRGPSEADMMQEYIHELRGAAEAAYAEGDLRDGDKQSIDKWLELANARLEEGDIQNTKAQLGNIVANHGDRLAGVLDRETIEEIRETVRG